METMLPIRNAASTHRQAREQGQHLLRQSIVGAAERLLAADGPEALTVRRIAQELECSTKVIYTLFRGKNGLANALYVEGSLRLQQAIERVSPLPDPSDYLRQIAWACWSFGKDNPGLYRLMFCGAIPDFVPNSGSLQTTQTSFERVVGTIEQYQIRGVMSTDDPVTLTKMFWASLYGVITLYLMGHFADMQEAQVIFTRVTEMLVSALVPAHI